MKNIKTIGFNEKIINYRKKKKKRFCLLQYETQFQDKYVFGYYY